MTLDPERFLSKVDRASALPCWKWKGAHDRRTKYGHVNVGGNTTTTAHRVAHELFIGPIPEGLVVDHLCSHPWCVNPTHLQAVTQAENLRRIGR